MPELLTAFPYQQAGAAFLARMPQALLADEMGLGKSCQAILAADALGLSSVLVICPAAVRINWAREFERFSPMDHEVTVILSGAQKIPSRGVVVCSYDLASSEKIRAALKARRWDVIVLDEAHYCKERSAKRTKAIYGHGSRSPGLIANADRVWRLTGTPAPNDASELYTHLRSAGVIDDQYWDFVYRFCTGFNSDYGFKITGHKNVDELKALLARFMLRRKKDEVMKDLPPITYHEVTVERSAVDVEVFFTEQLRGKTIADFNKGVMAQDEALRNALAAVQSSNRGAKENAPDQDKVKILEGLAPSLVTLRRYIGIAKTPAVCEILKAELDADPTLKLVIFGVHKDVIEGARKLLHKYGAVTLYGGTPVEKRQAHIDRFMTDPKCRVFIGNVVAAGTGITLTASNEVVFLEADWVPANNAQAAMRCHRIGQERRVRVRYFSCAGSVDEQIQQTLIRKSREIARIY